MSSAVVIKDFVRDNRIFILVPLLIFFFQLMFTGIFILKAGAIPSQFSDNDVVSSPPPKQSKLSEHSNSNIIVTMNNHSETEIKMEMPENDDTDSIIDDPLNFFEKSTSNLTPSYFTEISVQTDSELGDLQQDWDLSERLVTTESQLEVMTGLTDFQVLFLIERKLRATDSYIRRRRSRGYVDNGLTLRQQILLVMMKLKQNTDFAVLGIYFGLSKEVVETVFITLVEELRVALESEVYWPKSSETIEGLKNIGKTTFLDVRAILDTIQILLKPKFIPSLKMFKLVVVASPVNGRLNI